MNKLILSTAFFILGLISVILSASCNSNNHWNDVEFYEVEKQETMTEKPEDRAKDSVYASLHEEEAREMNVKVDMQFMKTENSSSEKACKLMNKQLIELVLQQSSELSVDEAVSQYIEHTKEDFQHDEVASVYQDHLTGRAEYGYKNIINYRLTEETFMGGAHPSTVTTILRFNASTGEFIQLEDVVPLPNQEELKEKLLEKLMADKRAQSLEDLHKMGYLEMDDLFISPNFALHEDSIEFYYNEYDIAPYAYGPSAICLSYEEVKDIITIPTE